MVYDHVSKVKPSSVHLPAKFSLVDAKSGEIGEMSNGKFYPNAPCRFCPLPVCAPIAEELQEIINERVPSWFFNTIFRIYIIWWNLKESLPCPKHVRLEY